MSRRDWEFEYVASDVAEGAARRAEYHDERSEYWREEVELAKAEIQESGIDIRSYEVTGGQRHDVQIYPSLAKRLSEAESKHQSHASDRDDYRKWERVLRIDPTKRLSLTLDDVVYFDLA